MNKDLEVVKALIKEMNEELKGKQKNIDVAAPFGKITGADFNKLRSMKKEDATDDKIDHSELNMLKKLYAKTPTDKIKAMIDKLEAKLGVKKENRFDMPQSVEDLPQYDGLYYVGGFVDIDGSPWVSREDAEEILKSLAEGQDHEVSMANNSLESIIWAANELKKHLGDQERDIPAWIQDHITNAENYILQAAKNFHDYGAEEEQGMEDTQDMSLSSLMEAEEINTKELSDIDHTRLVKWLAGNSNTNQYTIKKSGSGYVINTGELDKISVSGLKKYLRSQGWISDEKKVNEMSLEEMIKKVGSKYNVYSKKGKKLGSHPSKKKAKKQMAAIEISKQGK